LPWVAGPPEGRMAEAFERDFTDRSSGAPDADALDANSRAGYLAARRLLAALDAGSARTMAPAPSPIPPSATESR